MIKDCSVDNEISYSFYKQESKFQMSCCTKFYETICCVSNPKFPDPYNFQFNGRSKTDENQTIFESNFVKTSKYTWYDFLPKALILQFYRLANIYFLIIAILQTIPIIAPLGPLIAWAPLIVVLAISMIREGYEDFQRYKSDTEVNYEEKTHVMRNGKFEEVNWGQVVIGDICKAEAEELFPADMILLTSSMEGGNAFIETASLDGEKNLKPRSASPITQAVQNEAQLIQVSGEWEGIVPDKELHKFSSKMRFNNQLIVFYGDKQLLYRGARLKNTKWVYGLVIYTGKNTKIMMNSDSSSEKMSQIEKKVNSILALILLFQVVLCLIVAIFDGQTRDNLMASNTYIDWTSNSTGVDALLTFFTYFVLINTMIPISLIVSIEIVKLSQSYFINKDNLMYSEYRKKNVSVKTSSLNEELGQIQYVFTDKTGTLTMNLMEFKIAVIGKRMYGDLGLIINDPQRPPQTEKGFHDDDLTNLITNGTGNQSIQGVFAKNKEGGQQITFANQKDLAQQYLTCLAIAHEVVGQPDKKTGNIIYQGPSPDEISLVDAARQMKFQFVQTTKTTTKIKVKGTQKQFDLLQVFPFDSDRKRMSVVVRSNGIIKMYIKGADSIIKSRLARDQTLNLDDELTRFSRIGLRTLLIGMKIISEGEYSTFKKHVEALPSENKEQAVNKLVSDLQQSIYLIGATAVLDRLQDEVPETIRDLIRANIKVWMLTGDKMETAENIAKSCNLIQESFKILRYENKDEKNIANYLRNISKEAEEATQNGQSKGFLIEGHDLTPIIGSEENQIEFANLAKYCEAVVCCRLLPIQKAEVVRIVRERLNKITLSIGDGANDVPMIKTAHIGVGLFGEEGMGAVQASDYALPEFRMLWRLLLVHGRWNYMRIAEMILYFFYKNMMFTVPQFIFAFYCAYSGTTIFDDLYLSLYNLVFTALPLVVRAVLEQDVNYLTVKRPLTEEQPDQTTNSLVRNHHRNSYLLNSKQNKFLPADYTANKYLYKLFPKIYFIGQQNCIFNYSNYFLWVLEGAAQSCLITFFSIYILSSTSISQGGYSNDMWLVSLTMYFYTAVIFVVSFKLSSHTKFWSVMFFIAIILLSLGLYVGYMWITNASFQSFDYVYGTAYMFYTSGQTYFIVLFCICFVLFVDGIVLAIDYHRGGYASKMRDVIDAEKQENRSYYENISLKATELASMKNVPS